MVKKQIISFIAYSVDGNYIPFHPLQPKYVEDKYEDSDWAQAYSTLFSGELDPDISPEEFVESLNLYVFEINKIRKGTRSRQKRCYSRLSIEFISPLPTPTTLLLYGQFPSSFSVNKSHIIRMP